MPISTRIIGAAPYAGARVLSRTLFIATVLLLSVAATGCQRPARPETPTASTIRDEDVQSVWDTTLAVLLKHDFRPDRQDRTAGVITTIPTTSKQWHEPWRQDVADKYSLTEASLHTVQRKATVRFVHDKQWTVDVQVDVYRLAAPEYQITTASSAIRSFSGDLPTVTGEAVTDAQGARRWVHLGRDGAMEERLLSRILASY